MDLLLRLTKILKTTLNDRHLVAVSGGMDSMALLEVYLHFKKHFSLQFSVVYFHHGPTNDQLLLDYRFNAYELIKKKCVSEGLEFFSNYDGEDQKKFLKNFSQNHPLGKDQTQLKLPQSEAEFRQLRYDFMKDLLRHHKMDWLVLAHHSDDLLETRLMRIIRGVGPQGLPAMAIKSRERLRPLLKTSREELKAYLLSRKGSWLEDPSNEDQKPFRNWVRKKWLKDLEMTYPGSIKAMARSLDLILGKDQKKLDITSCFEGPFLILSQWYCFEAEDRKMVIANYMKSQGIKNYTLSHINELFKRLDTEKKHHTFSLAGRVWTVDAGRLSVQRLGQLSEDQ